MKLAGDSAFIVQALNNNPLLLDWFNVKASLLVTDSMYRQVLFHYQSTVL